MGNAKVISSLGLFTILLVVIWNTTAYGASLGETFSAHDPESTVRVDHSQWNKMLKSYVRADDSGLNRVDYAAWKKEDRDTLLAYIERLEKVDVAKLARDEQYAYWVNLYNAVTVALIIKHYPVASIRDIDISPGFFADGPWGAKLVEVNGVKLSLDNIEHDILRVNWRDPRVHYAVNCASVGCPNLARDAYRGKTLNAQLETAAFKHVASDRGVSFTDDGVTVSKIYDWYDEDFGGSEAAVLKHLRKYAKGEQAKRLERVSSINDYEYDWSLNDVRR